MKIIITKLAKSIPSSSANNGSALHLKLKQTNEKKTELYGGFDKDEMSQWWIKNNSNLPSMDNEQKKKIEYITGRNLSFLAGSEKNFEDALDQLKRILIKKIKPPLTNFTDIISESGRWNLHIQLMSSCSTNGYAPSGYGIDDYDHRFFYIDNGCCYYTSGFVRDCMVDYLFEKSILEVFATSSWIKCIKEFRNNPSVKGFMVEKACLSSIFRNGLMADAIHFKFDNYTFFTSIEEIDFSMNEGYAHFIYHVSGTKSQSMD
ncbi:hypothetical protein RCL_jg21267.t1 [Rhizophagus clarus]|uniref:Uncharacterized protein n=1 Tax=Rhizophagus clarus TaxID=94130 RepID=A0A8H3LX17_9GLOM|nr:hypothetical protein RCL_jg21267.t1 [Rhizophagus clarus]